jgi:hypothetical protein
MRPLSPPLKVIENNLLMPSENLLLPSANNDPVKPDEITEDNAPPLPPFLKELVRQRIAASDKYASLKKPSSGQILRIDKIVGPKGPIDSDLAHPLAVLINKQTENENVWSGWIVSPDTDYATHWDMLLERPEDEPFDPFAGMIQIWNPVQIYLPSYAPVLAALKPERLQAVRALAKEFDTDPDLDLSLSHPGQIAPRTTYEGFSILTGTPIGNDDPRKRYQEIYHTAAERLQKVVPVSTRLIEWLKGRFSEAIENGWLTPKDIFGDAAPAFLLDVVKRAKQINLGADHKVGLVITLEEQENQEVRVLIQVHPMSTETQNCLPENIKIMVIPESGEVHEYLPPNSPGFFQIEWFYEYGEQFSLIIQLNDLSVTEEFVI